VQRTAWIGLRRNEFTGPSRYHLHTVCTMVVFACWAVLSWHSQCRRCAIGTGPGADDSAPSMAALPAAIARRAEGLRSWSAKSPGKKLSRKARQKMRELHLGVPLSEEHRARIGEGHGGLKCSAAVRNRVSEGM
jgi:hypothetical protein